MKKLLIILSLAAAPVGVGFVSAQTPQPGRISFSLPAVGSTVGQTFTASGTYTGDCLPQGIMVLEYPKFDGVSVALNQQGLTVNERQKTFSQKVDTRQPLAGIQAPPVRNVYLKSGTITLRPYMPPGIADNCTVSDLRLTLNISPQSTVEPSPTPSPSPSVAPVMATPAPAPAKTKWPEWAWVLVGAVGGMALLGGAEYTAHVYRKRHPKG